MPDFVPDGHKYGWRFAKPWGYQRTITKGKYWTYYMDNAELYLRSSKGAQIEDRPLSLVAYWNDTAYNGTYYMKADVPVSVYLKFSSAENKSPIRASSFAALAQLEEGQYLARLTVMHQNPNNDTVFNASDTTGFKALFDASRGSWVMSVFENTALEDYGWDFCLEFSASSSPNIRSFSFYIGALKGAGSTNLGAPDASTKLEIYADDLVAPKIGGCLGSGGNGTTLDDSCLLAIERIEPCAFTYKNNMGGGGGSMTLAA